MKKLQDKLNELNAQIRELALEEIETLMQEYSIDISQLKVMPKTKATKSVKTSKKSKSNRKRGPQPAKYMNPETGATWTGLARPPSWIKGRDYSKFLIDEMDNTGT